MHRSYDVPLPPLQKPTRYNARRAAERFRPASTFKVHHALIALETGVADGPEFTLAWEDGEPGEPWWPESWKRDHSLREALPRSVVWYFQELARRIGPRRMQSHLDRFDYGNRDLSGGIDQFWLTGALWISADEQVRFLRRFYERELGVSRWSTEIVKELLVLEDGPGYRLSGKTGWAGLGGPDEPQTGWLVGYVEKGTAVYYFATNVEIRTNEDAAKRLSITKAVLRELGVLDGPGS